MCRLDLILLACLIGQIQTKQGLDETREANTKGSDVVQAVVDQIRDKCIFSNDRLFLRRLAVVQSNNGLDSRTFRKHFYGGIWQITEQQYNDTRNCPGNLSTVCNNILTKFDIIWQQTSWKDLLKPLYSGLAATLYIKHQYHQQIPSDLPSQASIWQLLFAAGQNLTKYIKINEIKNTCDATIDIVFVIDSSGSIINVDFQKTIEFMVKAVNGLPIGHDKIRIGVMQFNNDPYIEFHLNAFHDKSHLISAIRAIRRSSGGTETNKALIAADQAMFNAAHGMRDTSSKVLILVTDGASYDTAATVAAADVVKSHGITLFAVGVGGANLLELNSVATMPNCTHVFILQDFSQMDTILNEIQGRACRAHYLLQPTKDTGGDIVNMTGPIYTFQNKTEKVVKVSPMAGTNMSTLVTEATCSVVYIYASFESTHPGSALNEFTDIAVHGKPSVLSIIDDKGRPLYVTYEGRKLNHNNTCYNASFKTLSFKGKPPGADVICRRNGVEKECSRVDLQLSQYNKYLCQENWEHLKNPCEPLADLNQNSNLYHPVESDSKKFIRCDYLGNMYVNQCPEGHTYDPDTYTCGDQSLAETMPGRTPFPDHLKNPCLTAADKTGVQFFGHPTDKTKFVQCDFTKHTWVMGCPDKQVWQQIDRTCTVDFAWHPTSAPVTPDPSIKNPCTTGQEFFPIPHKPDQFIHCANGIMYVQSCAPHMHYDRVKHVCGTGEPIG